MQVPFHTGTDDCGNHLLPIESARTSSQRRFPHRAECYWWWGGLTSNCCKQHSLLLSTGSHLYTYRQPTPMYLKCSNSVNVLSFLWDISTINPFYMYASAMLFMFAFNVIRCLSWYWGKTFMEMAEKVNIIVNVITCPAICVFNKVSHKLVLWCGCDGRETVSLLLTLSLSDVPGRQLGTKNKARVSELGSDCAHLLLKNMCSLVCFISTTR